MPKKQTSDTSSKTYHLTELARLIVRQLCGCKTKQVDRFLSDFSKISASSLITTYSLVYVVGYKPGNSKPKELMTYGDIGANQWQFTGLIVDDEEVNFKINFGPSKDVLMIGEHFKEVDEFLEWGIKLHPEITKSSILSANFVYFVCSKVKKPIPYLEQRDDHGNRIIIKPYYWLNKDPFTQLNTHKDTFNDLGSNWIFEYEYSDDDWNHVIRDPVDGYAIRWAKIKVSPLQQMQSTQWQTENFEFTADKVFLWFQGDISYQNNLFTKFFKEVSHNDDTKCEQTHRCS